MTHTPVKLTFEQYLEYDDGTDNRYELFNGKLVEMPPASPLHSDIVEFLRFCPKIFDKMKTIRPNLNRG